MNNGRLVKIAASIGIMLLVCIGVAPKSLAWQGPKPVVVANRGDLIHSPSTVDELGQIIGGWMHKNTYNFFAATEDLFGAEPRVDDWSGLMESKIDSVASAMQGMKLQGQCKTSLCLYHADFDPAIRMDTASHDFGHQLVASNRDPQTRAAMCAYKATGPQTLTIYIFRGELGAAYYEPLKRRFGESHAGELPAGTPKSE